MSQVCDPRFPNNVSSLSECSPEHGRVCAVVVAYHPDSGIGDRIRRIREEIAAVLVVDNGSNANAVAELSAMQRAGEIDLILNESNEGIASALNRGMTWARGRGFAWALTLDQDSIVYPGILHAMKAIYAASADPHRVAVIGAAYDHKSDSAPLPDPKRVSAARGREVTVNITSGSLTSLAGYSTIGAFREEFFIDSVDQEFCLRARARGYIILASDVPLMTHSLGDYERERIFGLKIGHTNHSPLRRYYSSRNRLVLMREYATREPRWILDLCRRYVQDVVSVALFERRKREKLSAIVRGALDAMRGRFGRYTVLEETPGATSHGNRLA